VRSKGCKREIDFSVKFPKTPPYQAIRIPFPDLVFSDRFELPRSAVLSKPRQPEPGTP
jgi:hypothetical protein